MKTKLIDLLSKVYIAGFKEYDDNDAPNFATFLNDFINGNPEFKDIDEDTLIFLEADLREAFKAGLTKGTYPRYNQGELNEDEWIEQFIKEEVVEEETVPITYGLIKASCGWTKFCDVTGGNHYMHNEWTVEDTEIFQVKVSHAKQLNFI